VCTSTQPKTCGCQTNADCPTSHTCNTGSHTCV
jgi:hypothetical protein